MEYVDDNALGRCGVPDRRPSTITLLRRWRGRKLVCGSGTFLYFHGLNYAQQESDAASMFTDPVGNAALFEQYGVDYIYISNQERSQYALDESLIASPVSAVVQSGRYQHIRRVRARAGGYGLTAMRIKGGIGAR